MNTETVKQEIAQLLNTVSQPSRKQYPVAKHQNASLTELGLFELMPVGFGYTDAATIISAAQDAGGKQIGEGDMASSSEASVLFQLLNAVEVIAIETETQFQVGQTVRVLPHTQYSNLSQGTITSWMREHQHNGYKSAKIVAIFEDGSVEVEVNSFGDIDMVDISHLQALS